MTYVYEHETNKCPYCGSSSVVFDPQLNQYVCTLCGTVIVEKVVYHGYELRVYDERVPRTSGSSTHKVHDHGIGGTEFSVKRGSKAERNKWRNMRRMQKSIRVTKEEKIVEKTLRYMNMYAKILGAPNYVAETAGKILSEAVKGRNYKNKTLKNMAIAALYISYKMHGLHRPAKLFVKQVGITLKDLWHAEKKIHHNVKNLNKYMKVEEPETYVAFLVEKLGLSNDTEKLANYILDLAKKLGLHIGRPGIGLATAAVYLASILANEKRTQIEVAKAVNLTDVAIRNRYSDLIDSLKIQVYL
ncbi:MAG: transcription factor IIB [Desulfurococcales archaeon ex4484_58]|nr:MAG: transcription factor IIB [Desulfurococcales archaeon ex4484_58]